MPRPAPDYDAIIIGAGHNALVTASYLAKAGHRVAVFERRDLPGGAVSTREVVPGYRFDLGGSAHILIRLTPIVEELELDRHGLEYLELDPLFFAPFPDGDAFFIHRSVDRTCEHLEAKYPGQGEAYRRFVEEWRPFARLVRDLFLTVPSPLELGRRILFSRGIARDWRRAASTIRRPYGDVVDDYFSEEKLKAALVWMAAQSGPPPFEPLSAPFVLWQPLYHEGGIARPRGGSGMLAEALCRQIRAHGGEVHLDAPVDEILVEGRRAVGIRCRGQIYTARAIVAGVHAMETFGRLLPAEHRPAAAADMRVGNGFGAILRLALSEPVRYQAHGGREPRVALQLLCRDRAQIHAAYADYLRGEPARDPPLVAMTFSAVADTILAAFERYAPGTRRRVVGRLFQHPLAIEREFGMRHGNVMHLEMSVSQMFAWRPFPGMAGYRTHLGGLYLTGASTHPGGGIMGASGRNAARVVLRGLGRRRV